MDVTGRGFERSVLKARYDVASIKEDRWHSHTGRRTSHIVAAELAKSATTPQRLLNAGSGCHPLNIPGWDEIATDLFPLPLAAHQASVCASIENLPFSNGSFDAVICVGEVLAYCDPAQALKELIRVLASPGTLICDFGSCRSSKYFFTVSFGRSADLVIDRYNGSSETIWIYDPVYIRSILEDAGMRIIQEFGTHTWSAVGRRLGLSPDASFRAASWLHWMPIPASWAEITTLVARRQQTSTQ